MINARTHLQALACSAATLILSSCVVKDGSLDFTWWQDAAAPVMEDDVVIENGGGYYHSAPAPERIPAASIPKPESEQGIQQKASASPVAQQQPAQSTPPPAPAPEPAPAPKPAVSEPVISQNQPASNTTYTVRKGDTLSAIARRYNTTVRALVATNGMASANTPLQINQVLVIPQPGTTPTPRKVTAAPAPRKVATAPKAQPTATTKPATAIPGTHTVKPGDTIYGISRQYGVNPANLMKVNGLTPETANTIRVGATLRIPAAN